MSLRKKLKFATVTKFESSSVRLHKSRTLKVVAARGSVAIALQYIVRERRE